MSEDSGLVEVVLVELDEAKKRIAQLEGRKKSFHSEMPLAIENTKPFIISGIALSPGEWKGVTYMATEIARAASTLRGKNLILEHGKTPAGMRAVGKVLDSPFDEFLNALLFRAEVTDELVQQEILSGKWKAVSVKVAMDYIFDGDAIVGKNLECDDLSLTERPACQNCYLISIENSLHEKEAHEMSETNAGVTKKEEKPEGYKYPLYPSRYGYPYKYKEKRGMDMEDVLADLVERLDKVEAAFTTLAKKYEDDKAKYDEEDKKKVEKEAKTPPCPDEEEKKKKEEEAKKAPQMTPEEYAKWQEEEKKKKAKEEEAKAKPPEPKTGEVPTKEEKDEEEEKKKQKMSSESKPKEEVANPPASPQEKAMDIAKAESTAPPADEKKEAIEKASVGELLVHLWKNQKEE